MGGRGSAGGGTSNSSRNKSGVFSPVKPLTVETIYREARGWSQAYYKDTVLQAVDKGNGNVELTYATADKFEKTAKTNRTNYVTFTLDHGFVNDSPHGLNFEKISSFSGKTYPVKNELKRRGYKFRDGKWVKE